MNATTEMIPTETIVAPGTSDLTDALDAARAVYNDLDGQFFERAAEARCLVVGLIAREHVLLLGAPGTGKSAMTNEFCRAIQGNLFQRLLTKFTTDSEIFGPVSVRGLKDDKFERNTAGFLPTCDVAFLDEALALDTPILTPKGWTIIGDLVVGDEVFGRNGKPTKITALTPIRKHNSCFRVKFRDGAEVIADGGHSWLVKRESGACGVMSTTAILERINNKKDKRVRHAVPMTEPVQLPERDLPIDPYTLGVWLGNGNRWNGELYIRDAWIEETMRLIVKTYPEASIGKKNSEHLYTISMGGTGFRTALRELGLIQSPHYSSKAVPEQYLLASIAQRLLLLQGLMDTDGHVDAGGTCIFSNTNENIVDACVFLVRSFGIRCTKKATLDNRIGAKGPHQQCWKVTFRAGKINPFLARQVKIPRLTQDGYNAITSIEEVPSVPVRCITVDAVDHLFLAGEALTVTHNCFKANSAILNALLTALNERAFDNGPTRMPIPLQMCIGASNELPQDASLAALYDRFTLRRWVEGVKSETNLTAMLTMESEPCVTARLTAPQIETLREARKTVDVTTMIPVLLELFKALDKEHGIQVSDRTKRKCRKLVQANALFNGHTTVVKSDLRVLVDVLWNEPSERLLVEQTYTDTVGPDDAALAGQLIAAAIEAAGRVNLGERGRAFTVAASDANEKMNQILAELDKLQGPEADLARTRVIDLLSPIREELMKRIGHA